MAGRFLLDTNIVIALFASEPDVLARLQNAQQVFVPSVVIGELHYGARKSSRVQENLARIDQFATSVLVLSLEIDTARSYGDIKDRLRQKGKPIPENDIWIAALALQHDLILATRDEHFGDVENLKIEKW